MSGSNPSIVFTFRKQAVCLPHAINSYWGILRNVEGLNLFLRFEIWGCKFIFKIKSITGCMLWSVCATGVVPSASGVSCQSGYTSLLHPFPALVHPCNATSTDALTWAIFSPTMALITQETDISIISSCSQPPLPLPLWLHPLVLRWPLPPAGPWYMVRLST